MSFKREFKDASVLCITETWLDPLTPDIAVTAPGYTLFRADRCPVLSQKEKGGGVCFLVNQRWCNDAKLVSQSCSVELETLIINCRPFYSPREFSSVVLVGVHIPHEVNAAKAINQLADQILSVENANPDSVVIVVGDFNHTCLSKHYQDTNNTWTVQHAKAKHLTTVTRYTKEQITPVPVLH